MIRSSRLAFALLCTALPTAMSADETFPPITTLASEDMEWAKTPEGVAFAPLSGDRFKEAYAAMVTLPAGLVSPAHVKSADMFGLVVSGTMTHVAHGEDPGGAAQLEAGAYFHVPAGLPHVSSCVSAEECVTFLYQPGAFDFLPVTQ